MARSAWAAACAVLLLAPHAAARLCDTRSTNRRGYQGVLSSSAVTEVQKLGQGSFIRVQCLGVDELPLKTGCELPSMAVICRDDARDPVNCQSLAEFLYTERPAVDGDWWERGSMTGQQHMWILAIDGRGKAESCYPRSFNIGIVYEILSEEEGSESTAISLVVILFTVAVLLCVLTFLGVFFWRKKVMENAGIIPEHQMREVTESEMREREAERQKSPPRVYTQELHVSPAMDGTYTPAYQYNFKVDDGFKSGPVSPANPIHQEFPGRQVRFAHNNNNHNSPGGPPVDPNYGMYPARDPAQTHIDLSPVLYRDEHVGKATPAPPALKLACADCGSEIDHPATAATCPASGRAHPRHVDGSPRRAGQFGVACADCGVQIGGPNAPARCAVTGYIHPEDLKPMG
eukprot:TRINITY_DN32300_c0_g1_i1.p1 TRINITY_DN32300_c0_g1~~TRINITY_DN32300_c0_g1_i1.p1  ORF type:complete len:403 (+),score=107.64 TRINITY_DN32300_c0_g1_i1:59-1267(+)